MARTSAPPSDLEIEDPDGRSTGSGPSHRPALKPSRLLLIIAAVVAVLAVAFPFAPQFNRSEAGRLQGRWIEAISLDQARSADLTTVNIAGAPGDGAQVHTTAAGLYDQEAAALDSIRRSMHGDVIADSGLRRLRSAMGHALARQAADLRSAGRRWSASPAGGPSPYLDRQADTTAAMQSADDLLGRPSPAVFAAGTSAKAGTTFSGRRRHHRILPTIPRPADRGEPARRHHRRSSDHRYRPQRHPPGTGRRPSCGCRGSGGGPARLDGFSTSRCRREAIKLLRSSCPASLLGCVYRYGRPGHRRRRPLHLLGHLSRGHCRRG